MRRFFAFSFALLTVLGCDSSAEEARDAAPRPDARVADGGNPPNRDAGDDDRDAGDDDRDAGRDAGTDSGPPDECGCAAGSSCLRGTCIATCDADLSELDAALGEGLTVVAHYCVRPQAVATAGGDVFHVEATHERAREIFRVALVRWTPGTDPTPDTQALGQTEFPDSEVTLGVDDLRLAPDTQSALVTVRHYDRGGGGGHALFPLNGSGAIETDPIEDLDSPVLLDARTYVHQLSAQLVRGGAASGGVAELRPLGSFLPGELEVWREEGLLVAGFARRSGFSESDPTVYFVPVADAATTERAIDLANDPRVLRSTELPYDAFTVLPGGRFVDREDGVGMRVMTRGAEGIQLSERVVIANGTNVFYRVHALGDDLLLPHRGGILRVGAPR